MSHIHFALNVPIFTAPDVYFDNKCHFSDTIGKFILKVKKRKKQIAHKPQSISLAGL